MRVAVLLAALVASLTLVTAAHAAAPNYIVVHGPGLPRPVILGDWSENLRIYGALVQAPRASPSVVKTLGARPRLGLALFWGWQEFPRPTGPAKANQRGWFYPASGTQPAVIRVMVGGSDAARIVPARILRVLKSHGTPVRL